jgi:Peptidase propeptide and YPEB domain
MRSFFDDALEPTLNGAFICGSGWAAHNGCVNLLLASALCACRSWARQPNAVGAWRRRGLPLLLGVTLVLPGVSPAWGGDRRDHDRARAAVEAGQVMPLPTLLERLARTHPGQVLDIELEREDGRWIYEVKLLQSGGQLLKLELDAATGEVLKVRRKDERKVERRARSASEPS